MIFAFSSLTNYQIKKRTAVKNDLLVVNLFCLLVTANIVFLSVHNCLCSHLIPDLTGQQYQSFSFIVFPFSQN